MQQHRTNVWLVNTGWSAGPYGVGSRMRLAYTRAIIDAIHSGELSDAPTTPDPVFGTGVVTRCPGLPPEILCPRNTWSDKQAYDATAKRLAGLFRANFQAYEAAAGPELRSAGPVG
jgi:phosphoenolpyruvate carboxykinase (ATP)